MPIYSHKCQECGEISDHALPIAQRNTPQDCMFCGCADATKYEFVGCSNIGSERRVGPGRLIHDERQVVDEKGKDWREEGTNRRAGGAGRKIHFH